MGKGFLRRDFYPREKAAYIILRRKGVSISLLSKTFGRSTSVVHRLLKASREYFSDLRKFPPRVRQLARARQQRLMMLLAWAWETFMLGEGEEPP